MSWRIRLAALAVALWVALLAVPAHAHEFQPGVLHLREIGEGTFELRLTLPEASAEGAVRDGELLPVVPNHCTLAWQSPVAARVECGERGWVGPIGLTGLDRHPIDVVIDVEFADGREESTVLAPSDAPFMLGDKVTSKSVTFADYLVIGVGHIVFGFDHLLFLLGLVLLIRDRRTLVWTVTAFTLAHSATLAASTLGVITLPSAPVEAGIALSIVLLARELSMPDAERDSLSWRAPWLVALVFGLLHGFGFASALAEIGLPAGRAALSLFAFNLGVEVGQLAIVVGLLAMIALSARVPARPTVRVRLLAVYAMGSVSVAWLIDRVLGFPA